MKMGGMCFNWKVVTGLAAVGVGIWVVAPQLTLAALPFLLMAACPLSMVFMMRGMGGKQCASQPRQVASLPWTDQQPAPAAGSLAELQARSASLQRQHEQLAREIARLEALETPVVREAEAVVHAANQQVRGNVGH